MEQTLFRIHPELKDYIQNESPEENKLLEESLLAEGCRDPLVVWKEKNILVDGHHRLEICERHGIPFQVVYRSFSSVHAAKCWMRINQLSRRNIDKETRDQWIRELRAEWLTQKEIAETLGVTRMTVYRAQKDVTNVTSNNSDNSIPPPNLLEGKYFPDENSDNSTPTPTQNLEAIIAERVEQELYLIISSNRVGDGIGNPTEAIKPLDDDEKGSVRISEGTSPKGGNPNVNIINESGLGARGKLAPAAAEERGYLTPPLL
jgi:DNA-binding XRE family transcriptional regulator